MSNKAQTHTRGVTLIEMLVAFAIVSVTFVAVVEAFLSSSRATQMAQRQAEVADAISYVLADIAREAQVSEGYQVGSASITMTRKSGFTDINPETVVFSQSAFQMVKKIGSDVPVPITPPNIIFTNFSAIPGTDPSRIIINIEAKHAQSENDQKILLQTTFTQR